MVAIAIGRNLQHVFNWELFKEHRGSTVTFFAGKKNAGSEMPGGDLGKATRTMKGSHLRPRTAKTDMRTRSVSEEDLRAARAARKRQTSTAESDQACRKVLTKSRSESDILADEAAAQTCSHFAMRVARGVVRGEWCAPPMPSLPQHASDEEPPDDDAGGLVGCPLPVSAVACVWLQSMREGPPPSRPFASAPNPAGPTRLFASVQQSLPTSTQRPPRRAANDEPPGCQAQRNYRGQGGAAKDSPAHADAADAGPDRGAVAAFVKLVPLDALLEVEARFLAVTAIEQPKRLSVLYILLPVSYIRFIYR